MSPTRKEPGFGPGVGPGVSTGVRAESYKPKATSPGEKYSTLHIHTTINLRRCRMSPTRKEPGFGPGVGPGVSTGVRVQRLGQEMGLVGAQ
jgi:hypothetical protein